MITLKTIYKGGLRTEITHIQSDSIIYTDAPLDNHGLGEKFSPTDLFVAALGSCMLTIIGISANAHGFNVENATMETTKIMGTNPRRVAEIKIEVNLPENYSDKHKQIIEASANECPVANSLHPDVKQTIKFNYGTKIV